MSLPLNKNKKVVRDEDAIRIQREIDSWTNHLDLDKFNYNTTISTAFSETSILTSLLIGAVAIIFSIGKLEPIIQLTLILITILISLCFLDKIVSKYHRDIKNHSKSFRAREKMIRARYTLLGVDRDGMDKEFEDIKNTI